MNEDRSQTHTASRCYNVPLLGGTCKHKQYPQDVAVASGSGETFAISLYKNGNGKSNRNAAPARQWHFAAKHFTAIDLKSDAHALLCKGGIEKIRGSTNRRDRLNSGGGSAHTDHSKVTGCKCRPVQSLMTHLIRG